MTADTKVDSTTLSEQRRKFLIDVFTTALEGGIGYWSTCSVYHWMKPEFKDHPGYDDAMQDLQEFHAVIEPSSHEDGWGVWDDERDTQPLRIDAEVMHRGVVRFVQYCHGILDNQGLEVAPEDRNGLRPGHYWHQFLAADATSGEDGDYGAEVADQVVQWGLFGRGIYG